MPFFLEIELGTGARLKGHDHFWKVIREVGAGGAEFTITDIAMETSAHRDSVGDFIRRLTRAKPAIAKAVGWRTVKNGTWKTGTTRARTFKLLRFPHETPSLRRGGLDGAYGLGQQAMWNILRGPQARGGIDASELVMLAETPVGTIALGTAKAYLRRLEAAGYLVVEQAAAPDRLTRYRLPPRMATGPRAPKLLKASLVFDSNRRTVVGPIMAAEDSP